MPLAASQQAFVERAIRRQRLFAILSAVGVFVGLGLALKWGLDDTPSHPLEFVVVILILLNARNQMRQWRYAKAFEALTENTPPS